MSEISPALYRAGAGEPVLLLHGFTGTWRHWRPLLGDLAARYDVIAPTLAGHAGGEPYPAGVGVSAGSAVDLLERQLDDLGLTDVHVVGNSMGGALALELARRGRTRSVVALAPGGGWTPGDGEAPRVGRFFSRQLRLTRLAAPAMATVLRRPLGRHLAFRNIMRHGELVSPADAVDLAATSLQCTIAGRLIELLKADAELALTGLDAIRCPVLVASPQYDRVLPAERHAPRLLREIPGAEAVTLAGCGHVPMWDDTAAVLDTINGFIGRHANASSARRDAGTPAVSGAA